MTKIKPEVFKSVISARNIFGYGRAVFFDIALQLRTRDEGKTGLVGTKFEVGNEIPGPDGLDKYSGQLKIRIPKSLYVS